MNKKENIKYSQHPYEPYIPDNASNMIIGSIPPYRFCVKNLKLKDNDVSWYYGSQDNDFWKIIESIDCNVKFLYENNDKAIDERKKWLEKNHFGITDIVDVCIHKNGYSSDKDLVIIKYKKIYDLLIEYPKIDTLVCTSYFVFSKVKKVLMQEDQVKYFKDKNDNRKGYLEIGTKRYKVIILYSPSRLALRGMGKDGLEKRKKQYEDVFMNKKG